MVNRLHLACLAVLVFAATTSAQGAGVTPDELAATYMVGHRFGASSLTIEGGGRYSIEAGDCTREYSDSGTYVIKDGVLHFTILKKTVKGRGGERELNLLDAEERKEFYAESDAGAIKREFRLLPIRWSGRLYLIYEDELNNFANAVNLGLEPRPGLSAEPFYGSFYLRHGDERKGAAGRPALPGGWASFLLSKPLTATVVRIEGADKEQIATVNRGSRDGLKVGMRLVSKDEEPSPWWVTEVVSVGEKTARVRIRGGDELKSGDKLKSRFERRDVDR
jgi:hypothetical protein